MALILAETKCLEKERKSEIELHISLVTVTQGFRYRSATCENMSSKAFGVTRITHIPAQRRSQLQTAKALHPP